MRPVLFSGSICATIIALIPSISLINHAMQVKLYATLRPLLDGQSSVQVQAGPGDTVLDVLNEILQKWPVLQPELLKDGEISPRIHIFLNGREARYSGGLEMIIPENADLRIFPPVGGGA